MLCEERESPGQVLLAGDPVEIERSAAVLREPRRRRDALTGPDEVARIGDDHRGAGTGHGLRTGTRALLVAFAVFTLLAVFALLVLGAHTDELFAWTIRSRPNSTFLGAAYAAGFVLSVLALRRRRWSEIRVAVVTVTAFTVLTLIPTLLHLHRLHLMADAAGARLAAWTWLTVYVLAPVACLVVVVRQRRRRHRREAVLTPMPSGLVAILLAQGAALATAGAVMWLGGARVHVMVDVMRAPWPWPVPPLTSQVVGAWLLSFGFAIAVAVRERDLSRMSVPAAAYAAFGVFELLVLLAFGRTTGTDTRWLWIDAVVLAIVAATGAYGWWRARGAAVLPS